MSARFIVGDVFDVLATLEPNSVDLVFSSPPFLALRSYLPADHPDKAKEIGSEATPADFLDTLLDVVEACDRVLAPHGSLCFELGDTFAGSGGAGGDYAVGGFRDKIARTHDPSVGPPIPRVSGTSGPVPTKGAGWPLDKSLCGIPTLFAWSLAYGRNLLRPERETPRWRIRNLVAWARPNPPVGALGDKFRPATSYLTVATKARDRYFDLDAVRTPHKYPETATREGAKHRIKDHSAANPSTGWEHDNEWVMANPAGAPPLDYWVIPTAPFRGSHYATFPPDLCVKPIKAMTPLRVCRVCGEPSRRITEHLGEWRRLDPPDLDDFAYAMQKAMQRAEMTHYDVARELGVNESMVRHYLGKTGRANHQLPSIEAWEKLDVMLPFDGDIRERMTPVPPEYDTLDRGNREVAGRLSGGALAGDPPKVVATGWTDCGCHCPTCGGWRKVSQFGTRYYGTPPNRFDGAKPCPDCSDGRAWRPGVVLDPFAGSGTTLAVATGHGRDAIGIDIDERNADLALERVGALLLTVEHLDSESAA